METIEDKFNPVPLPGKKIKTIKPADFKYKAYLECEDDVLAFVDNLKAELLSAVHKNFRVRVQ